MDSTLIICYVFLCQLLSLRSLEEKPYLPGESGSVVSGNPILNTQWFQGQKKTFTYSLN